MNRSDLASRFRRLAVLREKFLENVVSQAHAKTFEALFEALQQDIRALVQHGTRLQTERSELGVRLSYARLCASSLQRECKITFQLSEPDDFGRQSVELDWHLSDIEFTLCGIVRLAETIEEVDTEIISTIVERLSSKFAAEFRHQIKRAESIARYYLAIEAAHRQINEVRTAHNLPSENFLSLD